MLTVFNFYHTLTQWEKSFKIAEDLKNPQEDLVINFMAPSGAGATITSKIRMDIWAIVKP